MERNVPNYIIKIKDKYLEYSTISDRPVTTGMTKEEFEEYYRDEYGRANFGELKYRMERVEQIGTSSRVHDNLEQLLETNRAGENGINLTVDEIYQAYCRWVPLNGWLPFKDQYDVEEAPTTKKG